MSKLRLLLSPILLCLIQPVAAQTTYYVSNTGSDANVGTGPTAPWKTLSHVSTFDMAPGFGPGDRILFERGGIWNEASPLTLTSAGSWAAPLGSPTGKITLGAYGSGADAPRLSGFQKGLTAECVKITNSFWRVENLQFEDAHRGILFYGAAAGVTDVEVVGCYFKRIENRTNPHAVSVGVFFDFHGWTNASVKHCCFDHVSTGVQVATGYNSTNFTVDDCDMFGGWAAGVSLQNVNGGRVTRTRIHDVGDSNPVGTTGLILVTCTNVIIDGCSISRVHHGDTSDGCGVDFESNNNGCELRNCLIYDTDGPAVLMFTGGGVPNLNITFADCLFYNTNLVRHDPFGSVDADAVMHLAAASGHPLSTGQIVNCGIYKNANSSTYFGGNWAGFTSTGVITAAHNQGWTPVYGRFNDLSVGGNGHICAVDSNNTIYRWSGSLTGNCWTQVAGLANVAQASIGEDGELWAKDTTNGVWRYTGGFSWSLASLPPMQKISVGSSVNVWALDTAGIPHLRNSSGTFVALPWTSPLGDLDAGPVKGDAWGLSGTAPLRFDINAATPTWISPGGTLTQISCHASYTNAQGTYHIAAGLNGSTIKRTLAGIGRWLTLPGSLAKVSEGSDGTLWGLDSSGYVWRRY